MCSGCPSVEVGVQILQSRVSALSMGVQRFSSKVGVQSFHPVSGFLFIGFRTNMARFVGVIHVGNELSDSEL